MKKFFFFTALLCLGLSFASVSFAQEFPVPLQPECSHRMYYGYVWSFRPNENPREKTSVCRDHPVAMTIFEDLSPFFQEAESITITYFFNSAPDTESVHVYVFNDDHVAYPIRGTAPEWVVRVKFDTTKVRMSDNLVLIGLLEYSDTRTYMAYRVPVGCNFKIGSFVVDETPDRALQVSKGQKAWHSQDRYLKWGSAEDPKDVKGKALANGIIRLVSIVKWLATSNKYVRCSYGVYEGDTTYVAAFISASGIDGAERMHSTEFSFEHSQRFKHIEVTKRMFTGNREGEKVVLNQETTESVAIRYPLPYQDGRLLASLTETSQLLLVEQAIEAVSRQFPKFK